MKRSSQVRLLLLGGLSAGAFTACAPGDRQPRVTTESVYANDYYLAGAGYYHAPFRAFFPQPYNFHDTGRGQYYFGGQWGNAPYRSIVNVSAPTPQAAAAAEAAREAIERGGFGSTARGSHIWS